MKRKRMSLAVVLGLAMCTGTLVACSSDDDAPADINTDDLSPLASNTGGAVLTFPEDHKLHNGTTMRNDDATEWFWWAGFGTSPDGKQLG